MLDYFYNERIVNPNNFDIDFTKPSTINTLLKERVVFYPGSGEDTEILDVFLKTQSAQVFLYSDYNREEFHMHESLLKNLKSKYNLLNIYTYYDSNNLINKYKKHVKEKIQDLVSIDSFDSLTTTVYLLETKEHFKFVIIYMNLDALFIYEQILKDKSVNLYTMYIKPMGFGGEYTDFGRNTPFEELARNINKYPKYMITHHEECTWGPWYNYRYIDSLNYGYEKIHLYKLILEE